MGTKSVTKKELLIKALIYRVVVIGGESFLASILIFFGLTNLFLYIIIVNLIKIGFYFEFDLGWFSFVKKPGVLKKIKRLLKIE